MAASGDGTTPLTAFKTIQEGHDAASPGDIIKVKGGTYDENVNATGLTITKNNLQFVADEPSQVTVGNTNVGATHCIYLDNVVKVKINDFIASDGNRALIGFGINNAASAQCNLTNCVTVLCATGYNLGGGGCVVNDCISLYDVIMVDFVSGNGTNFINDFIGVTFFINNTARGFIFRNGSTLNLLRRIDVGGAGYNIESEGGSAIISGLNSTASQIDDVLDPGTDLIILGNYHNQSKIGTNTSTETDLKTIYDKVTSINTTSNVSLSNTSEVTIKEWSSVTNTFNVDNFFIDYDAWATAQTGQTAVVKVYSKVDASNYRVIDDITITSEDAYTGLVFNTFSVANDVKITIKPDGNTTETIYYNYVARDE
jgi:hypothetical protein